MDAHEKPRKFRWNAGKRRAAQMLAEGKLAIGDIARKAKIDVSTLWDWRQHPEFAAYVKQMEAQYAALAERFSFGRVAKRVEVLDANWRDMQRLKKERGKSEKMRDVPGGKTGLLVHDVKAVGAGDHTQIVDVYRFDAALVKEMRETAREAAEELGQRRPECPEAAERPFVKVYLFDPRQLAREGVVNEPQRLPPVRADEPGANGPAAPA
jgi:hypothetical protein